MSRFNPFTHRRNGDVNPRTDWKFIIQIVLFFIPVGYVMVSDHIQVQDHKDRIKKQEAIVEEVRLGASQELKGYQVIVSVLNQRLDKIENGIDGIDKRIDGIVDRMGR